MSHVHFATIDYCYPSSPSAVRLKRGTLGCWVLVTYGTGRDPVEQEFGPFDTIKHARASLLEAYPYLVGWHCGIWANAAMPDGVPRVYSAITP